VSPDAELNANLDAAEAAELLSVERNLDEAGRAEIRRAAERLERWQETPDAPEALATVPRLGRADIDPDVKHTPLDLHQLHGVPISHAPLFTSGIAYIDFGFDLLQIPARLLSYVPLFVRALTSVGAGAYDMSKQSQRIGTYTGGIGVSSSIGTHRITHQPYANLFVRGKATLQNVPMLLELMRDIIVSPHLHNKERIMQMVREDKAGRESGILPSGHSYVNTRLRAPYSSNHTYAELTGGATYVAFIRHLAQRGDDAWNDIHTHFTEIKQLLFHHEAMRIHITANAEHGSTIMSHINAVMTSIPHGVRRPSDWSVAKYAHSEALQVPAQVNYVGVGGALSTIGYTCDGADIVVNRHLSRTFLHEAIREKGGAYGAFSVLDIRTGLLTMLSYRDPNLQKTLDTYRAAGAWLQTVQLDDDALLQAIIGAAGDFDGHQLPDARGFGAMSRLLSGDDDAYRQQVRQQALAVGNHHFARYGAALEAMSTHWRTVVLGGDAALQQQQTTTPGFFEHITTML
jgi:Zn-dependent M16 (insulinase) family peptidase